MDAIENGGGVTRAAPRAIVITGPTGWIGSAFLAAAIAAGYGSQLALFGSSAREVVAPDGTRHAMRALTNIQPADVDNAFVIHLAYLTKEKVDLLGERRFFDINTAIDESVLGALRGGRPRGLFVASSGAAALADSGRDRHLYGITKLLQEGRFLRYGRETGIPVVAGRIFNVAGPYINKLESYAISSVLMQALTRDMIEIVADMPVYRSYLHVRDLCAIVLGLLERGLGVDQPIDLCGAEAVEMIDIARAAARLCGLGEDAIRRGPLDFNRANVYLGDPTATKTAALRCGLPLSGFADQIVDTAAFIREMRPAQATGNKADVAVAAMYG